MQFNDWCNTAESNVGVHPLRILSGDPVRLNAGVAAMAVILPTHYAAEERVGAVLRRLGKIEAAKFVEGKLPTSKSIRSGDLGEILASEFIATQSGFQVPIKRLRWKDHRNMAMRGDDVIGFHHDPQAGRLLFLKTEAKSRAALTAAVVAEARTGLDKDGGLPSAHALSFIADRLAELGEEALADAILDALLKHGIQPQNVSHLLFTFSGNNPEAHLTGSLQTYAGGIAQWGVGLRVEGHGAFVAAVYDLVIANAYS
ncbi:Hachiman antiphage defense system protein HamA [Reyranella sp. CPCC 100927]|uniref:Hachiman antiphage defense system protein HamA n=1 Tax=Reyranella sp. CPCC 100927 TaxID=2599616 RepID=UPI0021053627|nr:Hachiman antiphage defense system protein HamA [Reyranella sp. CPCC 100927]